MPAIDSLTQPSRGENAFRNIVLPLASILETIATAKASKGHFVGNAATQAIQSYDQRRQQAIQNQMAQENMDLNRRYKEAQISQMGVEDPLKKLRIDKAQQEMAQKKAYEETAKGLPRPFTQGEDLQFKTRSFEELVKGRMGSGVSEEPLSKADKIKLERTYQKDFDALSSDFRKVRDSYGRIIASAEDPSPAGDLALIFNYMKVLDPGSVVRESEFATAEGARAALEKAKESGETVPNFIWGIINRLSTGQRMLENQRNDFVNRAGKLFQSQANIQQRQINRFTGIADRSNLNPENIIDPIIMKMLKEPIPTKKDNLEDGNEFEVVK